ncbi:MAG: HlyD family efflux transporter periplasmic adaptor subunit [Desulfovibrionaceae bacterium]|nr:HlyD family efflux transporter periplasmic adaptor subunit [Desulfovibrionaceae bacterium]
MPAIKKVLLLTLVAVSLGVLCAVVLKTRTAPPVVLHGNVEIRQVEVGFRVGGRIAALHVDEGTAVHAGTVLAHLDDDMLTQARDAARATLAGREADLQRLTNGYRVEEIAQAKAEHEAAMAAFATAEAEWKRVQALRGKEAVSQKILESARAEQARALGQMRSSAERRAMLEKGFRKEDILAQKALVASARAECTRAEIQLDDAVLRAPQDGIVLTRAREAGAIVQAGQTVFTLSLTNPVWLRVYVEEPDLWAVKPGMAVRVAVDGVQQSLEGTVGFISPTAEFAPKSVETRDVRASLVYRVRVQAQDPHTVLRQGMPVRVSLGTGNE